MHKTIENNWSRAVLLNFLSTDLYERQGKAVTNFALTLPAPQSDLAQAVTRDPYNFDFLTIRERYDEKELKDALMNNIEKQDKDFDLWFNEINTTEKEIIQYREMHYLPEIEYSYANFIKFTEERRELIKKQLETMLLM